MKRCVMGLCLLCAMALGLSVFAEETAPKAAAAAAKGPRIFVPYNKLTLTDEQKSKVAAIQAEYNVKIKALEDEEKAKIAALLTEDQKAELKKLDEEKAAAEKAGRAKAAEAKKAAKPQ